MTEPEREPLPLIKGLPDPESPWLTGRYNPTDDPDTVVPNTPEYE